jgi:hypothetical protein
MTGSPRGWACRKAGGGAADILYLSLMRYSIKCPGINQVELFLPVHFYGGKTLLPVTDPKVFTAGQQSPCKGDARLAPLCQSLLLGYDRMHLAAPVDIAPVRDTIAQLLLRGVLDNRAKITVTGNSLHLIGRQTVLRIYGTDKVGGQLNKLYAETVVL